MRIKAQKMGISKETFPSVVQIKESFDRVVKTRILFVINKLERQQAMHVCTQHHM